MIERLNLIRTRLLDSGFSIAAIKRTADDLGWRIELASGQIVNLYDTGSRNVQGRNPSVVREALKRALPEPDEPVSPTAINPTEKK